MLEVEGPSSSQKRHIGVFVLHDRDNLFIYCEWMLFLDVVHSEGKK